VTRVLAAVIWHSKQWFACQIKNDNDLTILICEQIITNKHYYQWLR